MKRRLYRNASDRMITGVAGGFAEYFNIDPVLMRLLWVLGAVFSGGLIVVVYFVMAIIVPTGPVAPTTEDASEPEPGEDAQAEAATDEGDPAATESQEPVPALVAQEEPPAAGANRRAGAAVIVGVALIVIGGISLLDSLDVFRAWQLWPVVLIAIGAWIIYSRRP